MLETSTLSLLFVMAGFILVAIIVVHHHNCSNEIRRKRLEIKHLKNELTAKANIFEQQMTQLQLQIDEIDEEIAALEQRGIA